MPVNVKVTCAWCQANKDTTLGAPIPEDWLVEEVKSPSHALGGDAVEEYFCCQGHYEEYMRQSPKAHQYAGEQYIQNFYSKMNDLRAEVASQPQAGK